MDRFRLAILVPLVHTGGLGSCTTSKTPKPPPPRRLSHFYAIGNRIFARAGAASQLKEARMQGSEFDFDVITGPSVPKPKPQPVPQPAPQRTR